MLLARSSSSRLPSGATNSSKWMSPATKSTVISRHPQESASWPGQSLSSFHLRKQDKRNSVHAHHTGQALTVDNTPRSAAHRALDTNKREQIKLCCQM